MEIEYSKFMFELTAEDRLRVSPFFENTLRGLVGAQIHKLCCSNTLEKCESCQNDQICLYSYLYNTPSRADSDNLSKYKTLPHPYLFYFPRGRLIFEKGESIFFYLTLFGRALNYLSYYVHAISNACKIGIGQSRVLLTLKNIEVISDGKNREKIYSAAEPFLNSFKRSYLDLESALARVSIDDCNAKKRLKINFNTAFRVKENERLKSEIDFSTIVKTLLRRFSNIAYFHCGKTSDINFREIIDKTEKIRILDKNIDWFEYERYSLRQKSKMFLGGVIGDITFESAGAWKDVLKIGEVIHIGKNTSFGFGNYNVEVIDNVE